MIRLFISPSDQDNNRGALDLHEQHYAQIRAAAMERTILTYARAVVTTRISQAGIGDDGGGYAASVREGNAWGHDYYHAEHSNAVGSGAPTASGFRVYIYPGDPVSRRWAELLIARCAHFFAGRPLIVEAPHLMELNSSTGHAVLVEAGFHDNPADAAVIMARSDEIGVQEGLAFLDLIGITHDLGQSQEEDMPTADEIAHAIWHGTVVHRADGNVVAIQELADAKTLGLANAGKIAALEETVAALSKGEGPSLDAIRDAAAAGVADVIGALADAARAEAAK